MKNCPSRPDGLSQPENNIEYMGKTFTLKNGLSRPIRSPAEASTLGDILCCPRCRSPLLLNHGYFCSNSSCSFSKTPFPVVGDQPALIDFDQSILRTTDLISKPMDSPRRPHWQMSLASLWAPRNRVSDRILSEMGERLHSVAGRARVLVIGGAELGLGLGQLYENPKLEIIATDIYASNITTLLADGHQLPFSNASMDAVVIQAVLEHVLAPHEVVSEVHRVLKPHGLVFADTPLMQQVHGGPYDFARFTVSGHRWIFKNFDLIEAGASQGAGSALIWSTRYFIRALTGSNKFGSAVALLFFWLRFLDGASRNHQDAAGGVYFFGNKSDRTLTPPEILSFYEWQTNQRVESQSRHN
jgi:SAM-dependent methyltransferase